MFSFFRGREREREKETGVREREREREGYKKMIHRWERERYEKR